MLAKVFRVRSVGAWVLVALAHLALPLTTYAQCSSGAGCSTSRLKDCSYSYSGGGASDKLSTPEPYRGQLFCPVSGEKLGLRSPAVPVQTTIGEKNPSLFGKMFGKKPTPGAVIHVCCPDCVAKVQSNPNLYLFELIADKACFAHTYASAPAKRPLRVRTEGSAYPDLPATELSGGPKTASVTGETRAAGGKPYP